MAIRLGKLKQQLHEKGIPKMPKYWNEKEVRDSVPSVPSMQPSIIGLFPLTIPKHQIAYLKYCIKATMLLEMLELIRL